jgi:hypothetical protein
MCEFKYCFLVKFQHFVHGNSFFSGLQLRRYIDNKFCDVFSKNLYFSKRLKLLQKFLETEIYEGFCPEECQNGVNSACTQTNLDKFLTIFEENFRTFNKTLKRIPKQSKPEYVILCLT